MRFRGFLLSAMLLLVLGVAKAAIPTVHYKTAQDQLSIEAQNSSLRQVLAAIADQSGVDIRMDMAAERNITLQIHERPLEKGLLQLLRGENSVFLYLSGDDDMAGHLIGVELLSPGTQAAQGLEPVATTTHTLTGTGASALIANGLSSNQPENNRYAIAMQDSRLIRIEHKSERREATARQAQARLDERQGRHASRLQWLEEKSSQRAAALRERRESYRHEQTRAIVVTPKVLP